MPEMSDVVSFGTEPRSVTGARVANGLADAIPQGLAATLAAARSFNDEEVRRGLSFLATILEIASLSAKALTEVQQEREQTARAVGWN